MSAARRALAGVLLATACAGCGGTVAGAAAGPGPQQDAVEEPAAPARPPSGRSAAPGTALLDSRPATLDALRAEDERRPVSVTVPGERSAAPVEVRTTDPVSGGMDLPDDAGTIAWWGSGTAPGEPQGTVVLAGHVSYRGSTGPFTDLVDVRRGAVVSVRSADGTVHRYAVHSVRSAPKTALDREALFRTTGRPTLVLVTCGGRFDEASGSYEDNVVVTALPA